MRQPTKTLISTIDHYKELGYRIPLEYVDNQLQNPQNGRRYQTNDVTIVAEERFEGMSNPSDSSIFCAISAIDGSKGYIVSTYGPLANAGLMQYLSHVPKTMAEI